eukprot:PITA_06291
MKEESYLVQPEGFVKKGQEHLVCKLKMTLYGLKQAPRSWYEKIDSFFVQHGFHRSLNDPNSYTKFNKQWQIIFISLYVDDLIIIGNANNLIKEIKHQMSQVFEMKDLGNLHYCLGLEVWKDSGQTFLTQGKYARSLLERFRMEQCRSAATPLQQNLKLSSDDGTKEVDATMYKQLVGFSDSDWEGNLDDRISITGYAFSIGSGVITWSSKKHSIVALSSCESEYQALCAATCEAIWFRRLLNDAAEEKKESTIIKTDNQSTIKLAYNPVFHKSTEHIYTQVHFVQEKQQSKEICVE